jgi:hypothetical protein
MRLKSKGAERLCLRLGSTIGSSIGFIAFEAKSASQRSVETGNILFKELQYLAGAFAAGVVVGAKVPIVLTSPADGELA